MPRKRTVREAVKGANYTTRGRGSKIEYTNNAWRIPRGTPRGSFDTYEHKRLRCSPKDNYLVGWTPKMTNAQVAKLVGQNKRDCYVRGIKVAYRLLDPYGWQSGPRLGARKRPPPDPPWSVKKSPVPKRSPPQSAKTSPVPKQSPPQSAKKSPVSKQSPLVVKGEVVSEEETLARDVSEFGLRAVYEKPARGGARKGSGRMSIGDSQLKEQIQGKFNFQEHTPKSAKKSPVSKQSPRRSSRIRRTPMKYR